MEKPENNALNAILETVEEIRKSQMQIVALKVRLASEAIALSTVADQNERIRSAVYAYWFAPEVHAVDLAMGATGRRNLSELHRHAGSVSLDIACDRCGIIIDVATREQMKRVLERVRKEAAWAEGYNVICSTCQTEVFEERDREYEKSAQAKAARAKEIAAMPYEEYLQTPEWRQQRERHLSNLLIGSRALLKCEACGENDDTGVYHKGLNRLGFNDDLVLLCVACLDALRGAGKLAGTPGPMHQLSKIYVRNLERQHLDPENGPIADFV
ncbi:hypothetical protein [Parasphingorhabdus sp.]|uniref:hypothetical protein n=1 Tax=Parasphingorhabdus sp. TaxID=2709688 RepID=UPI003D2DD291